MLRPRVLRVTVAAPVLRACFPRYGFRRIPRESASPAAQGSVEFREACPASAVTMVLELD